MSESNEQCRRVVVLDTSAFLAGYDPFAASTEQVTVPKVEEEILRNSMVKMRFQTAVESGKVKVRSPSQEFSVAAKASACKVGDSHKLCRSRHATPVACSNSKNKATHPK